MLFIDPASISSGWAFFSSGKLVRHGTIAVDKKLDVYERLNLIYAQYEVLATVLTAEGCQFDEVHIEQLVRNTHIYTHYSVGCIGAALSDVCNSIRGDIPIKSWQKFSEWEKVQAEFKRENRFNAASEDELAAICMGLYYTQGR